MADNTDATPSKSNQTVTHAKLDNPPENGAYTVHSKTTTNAPANNEPKQLTAAAPENSESKNDKPNGPNKIMSPSGPQDHTSTLPKIIKRPGEYIPMPYIFRVPCSSLNYQIKDGHVRCPPFYIQLDHTLAVVWALYSKEVIQRPLGINQLQWALGFLNNIRDSKGRHSEDVQICIDDINNELIEQYAELVDDIQYIKKGKSKHKKKTMRINSNEEFTPNETSSQNSVRVPSDTGSRTSNGEPAKAKSEIFVQRNIPFSLTYADMMSRCPENMGEDPNQNRPNNSTQTPPKRNCPPTCSGAGNSDPNYNKKAVMNFLQQMRTDQVQKISAELERLHSIEEYMTSGKGANFERYVDNNDTATLQTEKMNKKNKNQN